MEEPPLKKFKALFEQSDPDRIAKSSVEEYRHTQFQTLEQSVTQDATSGDPTQGKNVRSRALDPVAEEEEESASHSQTTSQRREVSQTLKRKTRTQDEDDDVEMLSADPDIPKPKRRALGSSSAATSDSHPGTAPDISSRSAAQPASGPHTSAGITQTSGGPDKDETFLKAIATKKRGKQTDDTFDREFNNLKISKPELERDDKRNDWRILEHFDDDGDLRGNFMVIVEVDVKDTGERNVRRGGGRLDWEGRPDFKKFKKVAFLTIGRTVELTFCTRNSLERDGNRSPCSWKTRPTSGLDLVSLIGAWSLSFTHFHVPEYWKSASQPKIATHSEIQSQESFSQTIRFSGPSKERRSAQIHFDFDDDSDDQRGTNGKSRSASRTTTPVIDEMTRSARSARRSPGRGQASARGKKSKKPLFLDDDDDDISELAEPMRDGDDGQAQPVTTQGSSRRGDAVRTMKARSAKSKAPAPILDDDSDEDVAFRGFGTRRK